jgi:hypothetical protein
METFLSIDNTRRNVSGGGGRYTVMQCKVWHNAREKEEVREEEDGWMVAYAWRPIEIIYAKRRR